MAQFIKYEVKTRHQKARDDEAQLVAELILETNGAANDIHAILDFLQGSKVLTTDSDILTDPQLIEQMSSLPLALSGKKPDWSDDHRKIWLLL